MYIVVHDFSSSGINLVNVIDTETGEVIEHLDRDAALSSGLLGIDDKSYTGIGHNFSVESGGTVSSQMGELSITFDFEDICCKLPSGKNVAYYSFNTGILIDDSYVGKLRGSSHLSVVLFYFTILSLYEDMFEDDMSIVCDKITVPYRRYQASGLLALYLSNVKFMVKVYDKPFIIPELQDELNSFVYNGLTYFYDNSCLVKVKNSILNSVSKVKENYVLDAKCKMLKTNSTFVDMVTGFIEITSCRHVELCSSHTYDFDYAVSIDTLVIRGREMKLNFNSSSYIAVCILVVDTSRENIDLLNSHLSLVDLSSYSVTKECFDIDFINKCIRSLIDTIVDFEFNIIDINTTDEAMSFMHEFFSADELSSVKNSKFISKFLLNKMCVFSNMKLFELLPVEIRSMFNVNDFTYDFHLGSLYNTYIKEIRKMGVDSIDVFKAMVDTVLRETELCVYRLSNGVLSFFGYVFNMVKNRYKEISEISRSVGSPVLCSSVSKQVHVDYKISHSVSSVKVYNKTDYIKIKELSDNINTMHDIIKSKYGYESDFVIDSFHNKEITVDSVYFTKNNYYVLVCKDTLDSLAKEFGEFGFAVPYYVQFAKTLSMALNRIEGIMFERITGYDSFYMDTLSQVTKINIQNVPIDDVLEHRKFLIQLERDKNMTIICTPEQSSLLN